jgi:hypothetical protein
MRCIMELLFHLFHRFSDKLCEEIDWCRPWVDPIILREKEIQNTMEAVFF